MKNPKGGAARASQETSKPAEPAKPIGRAPFFTRERLRRQLPLLALFVVTFCAYSNSLHGPFLFDNNQAILGDARLRAATTENVSRILTEPYSPASGLYRPLTTLTYWFNYSVLGNARGQTGYHCFNLLLHLLNVALVFYLSLALFEQLPLALLAAAIWSLHPVQTEAVTNIVGRGDMLAAFGVSAALLCHRNALRTEGSRRTGWIVGVAAAIAIGMFSKENAIAALAVIPLYDLAFARSEAWRRRLPSYVALAAPCLAFFLARLAVFAHAAPVWIPYTDNPLTGASFFAARLTAVKVIGKYLMLLVWPGTLSYDYSYNEIPLFRGNFGSWGDLQAILWAIVCLVMLIAAVRIYQARRTIFFCILFFFVTLAPVSNVFLIVGTIMADRLLYLPSIGFAFCAAWALFTFVRNPGALKVASAVILVAFAGRTYARNEDWGDAARFWAKGVATAPDSYKTNIAEAVTLMRAEKKDWRSAVADADRALEILKDLPPAETLSTAYAQAAAVYRAVGDAVEADPAVNPHWGGPGYWYAKSLDAARIGEKIAVAQASGPARNVALTFNPSNLYLQMGSDYVKLSAPERAITAFERGRVLDPNPALLEALGDAYASADQPRKAAQAYIEAFAVDPNRAGLIAKLPDLYGKADPQSCAVTRRGIQSSLNMECPIVHSDLCGASRNVIAGYERAGQRAEAEQIRRSAMQELGCSVDSLK
jgi:tetratricopeptide (TPR) repeat protein